MPPGQNTAAWPAKMIECDCEYCAQPFVARRRKQRFCSRAHARRARAEQEAARPRSTVFCCGGGVDSSAIALGIVQGRLARPEYAVMVDCGYERQRTWRYVHEWLRPRLLDVGVELAIIRTVDYGSNDLIDRHQRVVIPAYRMGPRGVVKLDTRCSGPWKAAVTRRWLREQGVERCRQWIGIAADEARRQRPSSLRWVAHRYPLIEWGWTRERCVYELGRAGWPLPPRSNCYLCPSHSQAEWAEMALNEPDDFALAMQVAVKLRERGVFLTPSLGGNLSGVRIQGDTP